MSKKYDFEITKITTDAYKFKIELPLINEADNKKYYGLIEFIDGKFKGCSYQGQSATLTLVDWDFMRQLAELIDDLASKYI